MLQGPQQASSNTKNLWQNDLKSLRNKMRTLIELGSIKNSTLKQFGKPLMCFVVITTEKEKHFQARVRVRLQQ